MAPFKRFTILFFLVLITINLFPEGNIKVVGIVDLKAKEGISNSIASSLSDLLNHYVFKYGSSKYKIISRNSREILLKEQEFALSSASDSISNALEMGRLLAATYMVFGNVGKIGSSYYVNLQLIEINTSIILSSSNDKTSSYDKIESIIDKAVHSLFNKTSEIESIDELYDQCFSLIDRGYGYKMSNDQQEADKYYKRALDVSKYALHNYPDNLKALYMISVSQLNVKNYQEAIKSFNRLIKINSDIPEAYYYLGFALQSTGYWKEAIENFKKAIKLDPNNYKYNLNCGRFLSSLGKDGRKDAVSYFVKASQIDRSAPEPFFLLGSTYSTLAGILETESMLNSDDSSLTNEINSLYQKAIESYNKAIAIDPYNSESYIFLGKIYKMNKEYYRAIVALRKGIKLNKTSPLVVFVYLDIGDCYLELGKIEAALNIYNIVKPLDEELADILLQQIQLCK